MYSCDDIARINLQFETQGFVHLKQVIPQAILSRAQVAFDAAAERHQEEWSRAVAAGAEDARFYDIPHILDQDGVFVDLVDLDTLLPVLVAVVGQDVQLNHTHARLFYPGKTFTNAWHSDIQHILGIDHGHCVNFMVKVHYYLEDLAPNQGCLAFVPGSHRYPALHPVSDILETEPSDRMVKIVPKAGDAILFNVHVLHYNQDNTTDRVRKSIIYAYAHYWMKHYANAVPSDTDKYANTHQRRQLFGIDEVGVPYFSRRLDGNLEEAPWYSTLISASNTLLKRVLHTSSYSQK